MLFKHYDIHTYCLIYYLICADNNDNNVVLHNNMILGYKYFLVIRRNNYLYELELYSLRLEQGKRWRANVEYLFTVLGAPRYVT